MYYSREGLGKFVLGHYHTFSKFISEYLSIKNYLKIYS